LPPQFSLLANEAYNRVSKREPSVAQPSSNAGPSSFVGFRADAGDEAALDAVCAHWQLNRSEALRRLVRLAAVSGKVRYAVDREAEVHLGVPCPARKWQVVRSWHGLIANLGHYDFRDGDVLDGRTTARDLIDALLARGLVEPL
jgi:nitrite reductase/ring-hydroxylating ferredoxin subunit